MKPNTNSETRDARDRRRRFIALDFGVNNADAPLPEQPAVPHARDVLP